ncbi:MAG: sigma-54 dependent transcriptional regulator [Thermoguttaceae bacterium]|nr:sigma-54 dependent transcriptional regulator [Thermoguttaceae bacterium]
MNILIVDDEANIRKTVGLYLKSAKHSCVMAATADEAISCAQKDRFDAAFLDLRLGVDNGLNIITPLLDKQDDLKIVIMTAYSSVDTAVEAMKLGAFDYIAKPFKPAQIDFILEKIEKIRQMENRLSTLDSDLKSQQPNSIFHSRNPGMCSLLEMARQVAETEAIVLLRDESGTGKTVLARAIHQWSHRAKAPFGVVSAPSLSPELLSSELFGHVRGAFTGAVQSQQGRIEACDHGTLFLDEIGDLPMEIQPKLLRFLQEKEYERVGETETRRADVRIIAATNVDLEKAVGEKRFREDLYFRLNVFPLTLPPLRSRLEDIDALADGILAFFARIYHKKMVRLAEETRRVFRNYTWPGNLRELRNVVERGVILSKGQEIGRNCLPESLYQGDDISIPDEDDKDESLAAMEKRHIKKILENASSFQEASQRLGIDQATLWRKRKLYEL